MSEHSAGICFTMRTMALMKLTFWGAAGTVTGSMHLLETGGKRYLLDCGLYQGRRKDADRRTASCLFRLVDRRGGALARPHRPQRQPADAGEERIRGPHLHHAGDLDLCNWMLRDTAHIQEKDAEFVNKRLEKRKAAGPVRTTATGSSSRSTRWRTPRRTLPLFQAVPYHEPRSCRPTLTL